MAEAESLIASNGKRLTDPIDGQIEMDPSDFAGTTVKDCKAQRKFRILALCGGVFLLILGVLGLLHWIGLFAKRDFKPQLTKDDTMRLYTMLRDLDFVMEKHKIRYWSAYGTLLGQFRHGGVIPWDDDGDFHVDSRDLSRMLDDQSFERDLNRLGYGFFVKNTLSNLRIYPLEGRLWDEFKNDPLPADRYTRYWTHPFVDLFPMVLDSGAKMAPFYVAAFDDAKLQRDNVYPLKRMKFGVALDGKDEDESGGFYLNVPKNSEKVLTDYFGDDCMTTMVTSWAAYDGLERGAINVKRAVRKEDRVPLRPTSLLYSDEEALAKLAGK